MGARATWFTEREDASAEAGFTMMEVIVGMTVMGIFMAIFMGSVVSMFGSSNRSQAVTHTSQQVNNAFIWLDRQIRYADYVSTPIQDSGDGGDWSVEFQKTDPATQQPVCYQLRVDETAGALQQRSWTASTAATDWQALATGVTNGDATADSDEQPFVLAPAATDQSSAPSQSAAPAVPAAQLTVNLVTSQGQGDNAAVSKASVNLVAFNTGAGSAPTGTNVCTGGGS